MSGGPIDQARRGRLAPPASTSPASALHAPHKAPGRAYCGRRKVQIGNPVTCSDCLAALAADRGVSSHGLTMGAASEGATGGNP